MKNTVISLSKVAAIAIATLASTSAFAQNNSTSMLGTLETGYRVEAVSFNEILDNGYHWVQKDSLFYKKHWNGDKQLNDSFDLKSYMDFGAGFGRYESSDNRPDRDQTKEVHVETFVTGKTRFSVEYDAGNKLKPEIGLEAHVQAKRINHRIEAGVDAVVGLTYVNDDYKVGARYNKIMLKHYHYPHKEGGNLKQNDGSVVSLFAEKTLKSGKIHGLELQYKEQPKGPYNNVRSYEPRAEEYKIAYYWKF